MSSISYQLLIIAQEYFSLGRLQANLQEVHHQYTSGLVCIGPQASPSSYVDWLFTASLQAVIKLIAPLVIQDAAFYTVHAWASVVGQAEPAAQIAKIHDTSFDLFLRIKLIFYAE